MYYYTSLSVDHDTHIMHTRVGFRDRAPQEIPTEAPELSPRTRNKPRKHAHIHRYLNANAEDVTPRKDAPPAADLEASQLSSQFLLSPMQLCCEREALRFQVTILVARSVANSASCCAWCGCDWSSRKRLFSERSAFTCASRYNELLIRRDRDSSSATFARSPAMSDLIGHQPDPARAASCI